MFTTINWNEKNVDDIYEYDSELTHNESLLFLMYLLEHYPEVNIEWISMFEGIKNNFLEEGRIEEILGFLNQPKMV